MSLLSGTILRLPERLRTLRLSPRDVQTRLVPMPKSLPDDVRFKFKSRKSSSTIRSARRGCPETAWMVASAPVFGVVDSTVALFSEMGQRNFERRPAARLTLVGDRAVMR